MTDQTIYSVLSTDEVPAVYSATSHESISSGIEIDPTVATRHRVTINLHAMHMLTITTLLLHGRTQQQSSAFIYTIYRTPHLPLLRRDHSRSLLIAAV